MNDQRTLAIDIGGTGLKASVLDAAGKMMHDKAWRPTPPGLAPNALIDELKALTTTLPDYDRISVGFPGAVRRGRVLTAPHFPGPDWHMFALADAVQNALGKPTRLGNDADIQGLGVVAGRGIECVLTLGTGAGTAIFEDGVIAPHMEFAHHPISGKKTYNDYVGRDALAKVGHKKWNKRVHHVIDILYALVFYDVLYIGGGNGRKVTGTLDASVKIVPNEAGITGGVKLWEGGNSADAVQWSSETTTPADTVQQQIRP